MSLIALYRTMVMARAIVRRLWVLERLENSPPHLVGRSGPGRAATLAGVGTLPLTHAGFEALQVAAAAALRPGIDWVVPCQLDLSLSLAIGMSPLDIMLAIFGRAADPASAARQAPVAFGSRAARIVMTSASAGRHVVQAAGIAYASKISGLDQVTLVCIDERGTLSGDWHEGINFAGAHALPLICLVEDRAGSLPAISPHSEGSPSARAEGYGLAAETIDGCDFAAASGAFSRAVDRARSKGGATLIHAQVVDLTSIAPDGARRPPEELEALAGRDPVERMRRQLLNQGVLDDAADDLIQRECAAVVAAAVREAQAADSPDGPQALENVFSRG